MSAPDLFELHQHFAHWAYVQAQAHPLEASTWLQMPYYAYAFTLLCVGAFVGWWLRWLLRNDSSPLMHEHNGKRFERLASGEWGQHIHDPETRRLKTVEVHEGEPPGLREPRIVLNSPRHRLKGVR